MPATFHIFGPVHLAILGMVPVLAAVLAALQRKFLPGGKAIRFGLAIALFACTAAYYGSFVVEGAPIFPFHVPLELCDASLWLALAALLTLNQAIFDVAYYWALAGASMALLTPNLIHPTPFLVVQFFADHGLIVVSVLYLVWSGQARPRPGSARRAMLALNIFAAAVGAFDSIFKTDYMFLRAKPPTVSLLDIMGPWPWYIVVCEGVGFGLFLLLYLPFWRLRSKAPTSNECRNHRPVKVPASQ